MTGPGIVLTPRHGAAWRFDAGALFLEFLLTGGPDDLAVFDRLHQPDDLRQWIDAGRLDLAGADVTVTPADIATGRELRDALWRATRATIAVDPVTGADRNTVDRVAAAPSLIPVWGARWRIPTDAQAVLSTVARDAIAVLAGAGDRVRECAADDCRLIFLDTSRPGARRWCSMRRCGNRHKVRDHRSRQRNHPEGAQS
jgi:predicted RNA-binding Zn ribbon-like protein